MGGGGGARHLTILTAEVCACDMPAKSTGYAGLKT